MTDDRLHLRRNRDELDRLRTLTGGLSAADLQCALGSDWNASTTLAHLAYWDRAVINSLRYFGTLSPDELAKRLAERAGWISDETIAPFLALGISAADAAVLSAEQINDRLAGGWSRIPARQAVSDVVDAAEVLTVEIAALAGDVESAIAASRFGWMLTPSAHWQEHIDEIETALAATRGGQA
jgi:hypothetical protein